jgi:hypothetical protein
MAFNIHWKIKFKSLRAGTDYTVNIWKDGSLPSGYPLTLKGGAQPFVTQEDEDEDPFVNVRQQSGYISIVDDGFATNANNAQVSFSWKSFIPQTDLDRPVTLTVGNTVVWQGFMQAQSFSGTLYGGVQEREFPVQCILSVMEAKDIDHTQKDVHNFAYLLDKCFYSVGITPSSSPISLGNIYFQGEYGIAKNFLMSLIDWQNFVTDNGDGSSILPRFDAMTALTDVCRFWGWTARTHGRDIYFCCADDTSSVPGFLRLTHSQLQSIGNETDTTVGTDVDYDEVDLDDAGDIFASFDNDEIQARGASTAVVTADSGIAPDAIVEAWPEYISRSMLADNWGDIKEYYSWQGVNGNSGEWKEERAYAKYTTARQSVQTPYFKVTTDQTYASVRLAQFSTDYAELQYAVSINYQNIIQLGKEYDGSRVLAQIETEFEHIYDGHFQIKGDVYRGGYCYHTNSYTLNHSIKMRFGIGKTRATAKWYDGLYTWNDSPTIFDAHVNFNDGIWRFGDSVRDSIWVLEAGQGKKGKVFIDLLGGIGENDWFPDGSFPLGGIFYLDIVNFTLSYTRFSYDFLTSKRVQLDGRKEYSASNDNMSRNRWDDDTVYASGDLDFGFGLVFNHDTLRPLVNATYYSGSQPPEQHLANRVASYWATAKRVVKADLRSEIAAVGGLTPGKMVMLDGWGFYPIGISREWRDDVSNITFIEI